MARIGGPGMNGTTMLVVALLLVVAILVVWPAQRIRARRRRVLGSSRGATGANPDDALIEWIRDLARGRDGSTDEFGGVPVSVHPDVLAQPTAASAISSGRTAVAWSTRDLDDAPGRSWATGGPEGPTRPAGPARPPARRDSRRPAATARPETLEAVEHRDHLPVRDTGGLLAEPPGQKSGGPLANLPVRARRSPRRVLLLVGLVGAGVGAVAAGPVAAVAVASYGTLATRALLRWRANRQAEVIRRHALDLLCGLAADLRAGLPVPSTLEIAAVEATAGTDRLRDLTSAAVRLADRTGAPLAELIERIEADARATDRGLAAAAAQAAGARATAWLLAALPVGGIGLGYGIGVDPLTVLLHSTVGGVCAVLAVALQVVGLFWAERLGSAPGRAA
ncbi:hypothetical protein ACLQ24_13875 [Micromonospora sp. DT4]|uniref:type II secretion system F family protein n=1 Tax=Micromonospora sp. DT4 TaxID=3393438 RepID=UPI003CF827F7